MKVSIALRLLCLFMMLGFLSCRKEKPGTAPQPRIFYKPLNISLNPQSAPLQLDLNEDGIADFEFYTHNFSSDVDQLESFLVHCKDGNKIMLINNSHNTINNSHMLMSYTADQPISAEADAGYRWDSGSGILAMKHTSNTTTYIGRWSDENIKFMAVQLSSNNKVQYGWIKLSFSKAQNGLTLLDYAFHMQPGAGIRSGQMKR